MRFNAAAKASALLKAGVLSTLACTIGLSNFAIAEELPLSVTGGQVCQAANLSQAQIGGGIVWQANGIANNTGSTLWVICALTTGYSAGSQTSGLVIVRNTTGESQAVDCVTKVIGTNGNVVVTTAYDFNIAPNGNDGTYFGFTKTDDDFVQSATLSCKLPSGTALVSIATSTSDTPL